MDTKGAIIIIENNISEQILLAEIFKIIGCENDIEFFVNGDEALDFIISSNRIPFLIISDVNLHMLNGIDIKNQFEECLSTYYLNIPFLFISTTVAPAEISKIYKKHIQGLFIKPSNLHDYINLIKSIVSYWSNCVPNLQLANEVRSNQILFEPMATIHAN